MRIRPVAIVVAVAAALAAPLPAQKLDVELQRANEKATATGDLKAAIDDYKKIVSRAGSNRAIAVQALIRLAECYQKMGDAESRKVYEQIVNDYSDQREAVALARVRLGDGGRPGQLTNRLVWKGDKITNETAISPDGRYLAYTDWNAGNLMLLELATGAERRVTDTRQSGKPKLIAEAAAFSRDGKRIAYNWTDEIRDKDELRVASLADPANPRTLCSIKNNGWFNPRDWSPDGQWIVAWADRDQDPNGQMILISVRDGSQRTLKTMDKPGPARIFFSPDGKYLAYDLGVSLTQKKTGAFLLALDGATETPAITQGGESHLLGWSPDGKRLLFANNLNGSMSLWARSIVAGSARGAAELLKAGLGGHRSLGMTASGALYYWADLSFRQILQVVPFDFDAGRITAAPTDIPSETDASLSAPSWSPDGKYFGYFSTPDSRLSAGNRSVVIRSGDTSRILREFPVKVNGSNEVNWAPDGQSFLTSGVSPDLLRGIYQIDAATGNASLLIPEQTTMPMPRWSPDGKNIYFIRRLSDDQGFAVIEWDAALKTERELVRRSFLLVPYLSPDGRYIASESVDAATNSRVMLLIATADGRVREVMRVPSGVEPGDLSGPQAIQTKGQAILGAIWALDSRSFLVRKRSADSRQEDEVWRIPLNGDAPRKVELTFARNTPLVVGLSPDGHKIAYGIGHGHRGNERELWVLEHFLPPTAAVR